MEIPSTSIDNKQGKTVLIIIMALSCAVVVLFWAAIQCFHLEGLPLYFMQLGLYLLLFLFALLGLKKEQINLSINLRRIWQALAWTLVSWAVFLLVIQLLGMVRVSDAFQVLGSTPAWKIGANILSTWIFVGMGEEVLFRSYFLNAFLRHFTHGTDRRRRVLAMLLVSAFFSLWHLPNRILWLITGEINLLLFLISLLVLFLLGLGYAILYVRSDNILLAGLVHGISDFPLVGMNTQMAPVILLAAIGCVEIQRLVLRKRAKAIRQP